MPASERVNELACEQLVKCRARGQPPRVLGAAPLSRRLTSCGVPQFVYGFFSRRLPINQALTRKSTQIRQSALYPRHSEWQEYRRVPTQSSRTGDLCECK